MSDETKPYDPWEATDDDTRHAIGAYSEARSSGGDVVIGMLAAMQVYGDRVRARVEAYQAAGTSKPEPHHDKPWVKIGNWILQPDKIARVNIAEAIDGPGGGFGELKHDEIQALLAYLTNPVRCVDLTPAVATTTANP